MANAIYANALACSRANKMLGLDRLNRMADASDLTQALKVCAETGFGGGENGDYEKMLEFEKKELFDFVRVEAPSERFKKFFLIANDYHNAEALIKAKYTTVNVDDLLVADGVFSAEKMKGDIMVDKYDKLPKTLQTALKKCDEDFAFNRATGLSVSSNLKRALYSELFEIAKRDKLLSAIYSVKADYANVSLALRSRDFEFTKEHKVVGGKLTDSQLQALCEEPFETLKEQFKGFGDRLDITSAIEAAAVKKPLAAFEKSAESYAVKKLKERKYEISGIYPFVYYCYNKLSEIENARIVLAGKSADASVNDVKWRMRESYEG